MDTKTPGNRIKEMRRQRGWSLAMAARSMDMMVETLRLIESDITMRPQAATRERMKAVLGVDVFNEIRGGHVTA